MSVALITMMIVFIILVVLSVPMCFAIGLASLSALLVNDITLHILAQRIFAAVDSFTLLAIPLYILCGELMMVGGIAQRLIEFCRALIGWIVGGMAYMTILGSMFFGAISGSALATTKTIGGMMYPELIRSKYRPEFAASLGAVGGTLGILIPPSIAFVVFGTQTGTSVVRLFMGGAIAGIIVGIAYMIAARITLKFTPQQTEVCDRPSFKELVRAFIGAFWGLLAPVIILGGIYTGVFTATEAAVIAVVYCAFVEFFIYKELDIKSFIKVFYESAASAAGLLFLIAVASLYSWLMSVEGVSRMLGAAIVADGITPTVFLLIVNVIYLILGMLIDTTPIIILTSPILYPVAMTLGIDPIHFGVMTVVNLAYGLITPPFGICIFMSSTYSKQNVANIIKSTFWFYLFGIAAILIVTYLPQTFMWFTK